VVLFLGGYAWLEGERELAFFMLAQAAVWSRTERKEGEEEKAGRFSGDSTKGKGETGSSVVELAT